jgi:hypothetical protein
MTAERWKRVQDLFAEAADLPESERHAFLSAVCGADEDLRRELDSLFRYDSEPGAPLAALVGDASYRVLLELAELQAEYWNLSALLALRRNRSGALGISETMRAVAEKIATARRYEAQAIAYQTQARGRNDTAERERDWRAARDWFERSRDAWNELGEIPELRPVDAEVARLNARMADCDAQFGGIAVPKE